MMAAPTVIDANCMKYFQEERVKGQPATYSAMMEKVMEKGCIAIDREGRAQQEYNACCEPSAVGLNLCDWIADQIVGKVVVAFQMDKGAEKALRQMGVPHKDLKWPAIAKGAAADIILTEDIDLFEPTAKNYPSHKKDRIKQQGGPVSRFLLKKHGVEVSTAASFLK